MPYYLRFLNNPVLELGSPVEDVRNKTKSTSKANHAFVHRDSKDVEVRIKISCTTDLGEAYYDNDLHVAIKLLASMSGETVAYGNVDWKKGMRVLSEGAVLRCLQRLDPREHYWLSLDALPVDYQQDKLAFQSFSKCKTASLSHISSIGMNTLFIDSMPEVISISAPTIWSTRNKTSPWTDDIDQHVLRRLGVSHIHVPGVHVSGAHNQSLQSKDEQLELLIYEEMGESIARHIWDAGLALLASCTANFRCDDIQEDRSRKDINMWHLISPLFDSYKRKSERRLQILELGSGCGIVGLGLARLIPDAEFILTDLPEAMAILDKNISTTRRIGLTSGTTVHGQVLDWDSALANPPSTMAIIDDRKHGTALLRPDLVLVSDCTYNPSSFKALVATLVQVVKQAHKHDPHEGHLKLDVLVSYKIRHESESRFFKDMQEAGFEILANNDVVFPDRSRTQIGLDPEKAEIYAFGLKLRNR